MSEEQKGDVLTAAHDVITSNETLDDAIFDAEIDDGPPASLMVIWASFSSKVNCPGIPSYY
jgi:hypothetical protein